MSPSRKRDAARHLAKKFAVSQRRACRVVDQHRSSQRYESTPRSDEGPILKRMSELVRRHPRYGYRRIGALLRAEGFRLNAKRAFRLWRGEGFKVPRKQVKKRRVGSSANACHRRRAAGKNDVWAWDFAFDRTTGGSTLKWLSIVDEFTRECLALKVARGITAEDLIETLAALFRQRGVPNHIRSDNGPEFAAKAIRRWTEQLQIGTLYVAPASPWENGYAESFHSKLRDEFLAAEEFGSLREAQALTSVWKREYNETRPHSSLGYVAPAAFARTCEASVRPPASLPPRTS